MIFLSLCLKKGAELTNLIYKGEEFMWEANPTFWGKTSPILFPFIGGSINDQFMYEGNTYQAHKHGFARDYNFELAEQRDDFLSFVLKSSPKTMQYYPFDFELFMNYKIKSDGLVFNYQVVNVSDKEMYFCLGGHPAFAMPVNDDISISDYYVAFEEEESSESFVVDGVLLQTDKIPALDGKTLNLTPLTFEKDAYVFDDLKSTSVTLKCRKNTRSVKVDFENFPYLALWNKANAPYLCIEPWCGVNDFVHSSGNLVEKIGVQKLTGKSTFERNIEVTLGL